MLNLGFNLFPINHNMYKIILTLGKGLQQYNQNRTDFYQIASATESRDVAKNKFGGLDFGGSIEFGLIS